MLIHDKARKQSTMTKSSAEAKFKAIAHEICEIVWIKRFLKDMKILKSTPVKVYCNYKATISIISL